MVVRPSLDKYESARRPEGGKKPLRPFPVILALTSCSPFLFVLELWGEADLLRLDVCHCL